MPNISWFSGFGTLINSWDYLCNFQWCYTEDSWGKKRSGKEAVSKNCVCVSTAPCFSSITWMFWPEQNEQHHSPPRKFLTFLSQSSVMWGRGIHAFSTQKAQGSQPRSIGLTRHQKWYQSRQKEARTSNGRTTWASHQQNLEEILRGTVFLN